jgi:hypothetical protein
VGAAAAGAAYGYPYGGYGGNSCWQWNGYNWVWAC